MNQEFFEVYDENGTYGFFVDEKNAEACAEFFEINNYGDKCEPNVTHVFIASRSFDDFYWA